VQRVPEIRVLPHAVAVAADRDDVAVVDEPIATFSCFVNSTFSDVCSNRDAGGSPQSHGQLHAVAPGRVARQADVVIPARGGRLTVPGGGPTITRA